jgi:hypothetical protein
LLIRQQFLQPDDLPRQLGDAFLSGLDDRQASLEIGEVAVGQLAVFLQAVPDSTAENVQSFLDSPGQGTFLRLQPFRELGVSGHLAVRQLRHTAFQGCEIGSPARRLHRQDKD